MNSLAELLAAGAAADSAADWLAMGGVAVALSAVRAGRDAVWEVLRALKKGRRPSMPSLMAKIAETMRNMPVVPARNQRMVCLKVGLVGG